MGVFDDNCEIISHFYTKTYVAAPDMNLLVKAFRMRVAAYGFMCVSQKLFLILIITKYSFSRLSLFYNTG